jgi:chromosome segregation ATPase
MVEETPETPTDRKAEFEKDWEQVRTGFGVLERKTAEALDIHAAKLTTAIQQMQQKGDGGFHAADGVAEFQLKLASSEERSRMLETTLSEMRSDHAMEKKIQSDQYELHQEQYSNRALTAEADLHKLRAEFDIYQQRMQRIEQSHEQQKQRTSVAEQSLQKVRFGTHLCCSQASTRDEDVVALRDANAAAEIAEAQKDNAMLRARIADLETAVTSHAEDMAKWEHVRSRLEIELEYRQRSLNLANTHELELVSMLGEIHSRIEVAHKKPGLIQTHATEIAYTNKPKQAMVQMPDKVKDSFDVNQDVDGRSSDSGSTRCDPFSPLSSSYSTRPSGLWEYSTN